MFQWISSYPSKVIIGGTVSVDTFFVISGTLLTYTFLTHAQNTDQVNWFLFYFLRYVRIAAPTSVGVIVFACAIHFLDQAHYGQTHITTCKWLVKNFGGVHCCLYRIT